MKRIKAFSIAACVSGLFMFISGCVMDKNEYASVADQQAPPPTSSQVDSPVLTF